MTSLSDALFAVSPDVRYVAVYTGGEPSLHQRAGLEGGSDASSDRFEELLVNPTLLTLVRQRGEIDCGGLSYVLIRYGNFFQFVQPIDGGHVSVAIEPIDDPMPIVDGLRAAVARGASPVR